MGSERKRRSTPDLSNRGRRSKWRTPKAKVARHWNSKVRPERLAAQGLGAISADKIKELRGLGFTSAQLVPSAGIFRGSSCLISLRDGDSGERVISKRVAQCAAFEHGGGGYPGSLMGSIAMVRQTLYDAQWQRDSLEKYRKNSKGIERVEANDSLDALRPVVDGKQRVLFRTRDELSYSRFAKVAAEFKLKSAFLGCGSEYRVATAIKAMAAPLVLHLNFPDARAGGGHRRCFRCVVGGVGALGTCTLQRRDDGAGCGAFFNQHGAAG